MSVDVIVIGGGISGLSLALQLRARHKTVLLLEEQSRVGGSMRTSFRDGYLLEHGPNTTALSNMALYATIRDVGLEPSLLLPSDVSRKRFIVRDEVLTPLPMSPGSLFISDAFTSRGKWRMFKEPFVPKGRDAMETVSQFFERRMGKDITEYAVKPFISGIYAGDADALAMSAAFPNVFKTEQEYGSMLTGFVRRGLSGATKKVKPPHSGKSITFTNGMESLSQAICASLGDSVVTGAGDVSLTPSSNEVAVSWTKNGATHRETAPDVVLSCPAFASSQLLRDVDSDASRALASIDYAPVGILHLGYARDSIRHPLDGFGFLSPPIEGMSVLGCLFSSSLYPGRAPDRHVLLTVFLMGTRHREQLEWTDDQLTSAALGDLEPLLDITGDPTLRVITRIPRAIPQYTVPYVRALESLKPFELKHSNVHFCNNFLGGASIGDCAASAEAMADLISRPE